MTGIMPPNALSYIGQVVVPFINRTFPPNSTFNDFTVPTVWIDTANQNAYILVAKPLGVADWVLLGGTPGNLNTLTADSGGAIAPVANNINILGDGTNLTTVGNPGTGTITIETAGGIATTYTGDLGTATASLGNLNVVGTTGIAGAGAGIFVNASGDFLSFEMNSPFSLSNFVFSGNTASTPRTVTIENLSNTSGSDAALIISNTGPIGGDPYVEFKSANNRSGLIGYILSQNELIIGTGVNGITPTTATPKFLMRQNTNDILLQVSAVTQNVNSGSGAVLTVQNTNGTAGGSAHINVIAGGGAALADSFICFTTFNTVTGFCLGLQQSTDAYIMSYDSGAGGDLSSGTQWYKFDPATQESIFAFSVETQGTSQFDQALVANITVPGAYPYNVLNTDYMIGVDTSGGARTINLPNAPTSSREQVFIIKDTTGNAGANNITVTTPGGVVLIDGAATASIASNYGVLRVIFNGTKYLTW